MPGVHASRSAKQRASSAEAASASAAAIGRSCKCWPASSPATPVSASEAVSARPRRRRSFSSASERRVYTGSTPAGSPEPSAPAAAGLAAASKSPSPDGCHSDSSTREVRPAASNRAPWRLRPSPVSWISAASARAAHAATASLAFTTCSRSNRRAIPSSPTRYSAGYSSPRMASAATPTRPRTPARHAVHAAASSVETPYSGTLAASARPFAVEMPMRTPVNDPGPRPTSTASSPATLAPARASARSNVSISSTFARRRHAWSPEAKSSTAAGPPAS